MRVAARILDSVGKADCAPSRPCAGRAVPRPGRDIWSELTPRRVTSARRGASCSANTQRAWPRVLLRPGAQGRADARSLLRQQARQLQAQLDHALKRPAPMDAATRAHLLDSADTLAQALSAKLPRAGV
jgi:hypothetical protein